MRRDRRRQQRRQPVVDLDRSDGTGDIEQAQGQRPQPRPHLQHVSVGADRGGRDDPADRIAVVDEVLSQALRRTEVESRCEATDLGRAEQPDRRVGRLCGGGPVEICCRRFVGSSRRPRLVDHLIILTRRNGRAPHDDPGNDERPPGLQADPSQAATG